MPKVSRKRSVTHKKKEQSSTTLALIVLGVVVVGGGLIFWVSAERGNVDTGGINLPSYAYMTPELTQGYVGAVKLGQLFEYMPCYCGCAEMAHLAVPHRNLRNCFVKDDGTFEQHAASCSTCVDIAIQVMAMARNNARPIDIRNAVDQKYTTGANAGMYPPPTPTPMPPG